MPKHPRTGGAFPFAAWWTLFALLSASAGAEIGLETLAVRGDPVPDGRLSQVFEAFVDPEFDGAFGPPSIAANGRVAFLGGVSRVRRDNRGLFARDRGGSLVRIAQPGELLPGFPYPVREAIQFRADALGRITVLLSIERSDGFPRLAMFREDGGRFARLLELGTPAPGLPAHTVVNFWQKLGFHDSGAITTAGWTGETQPLWLFDPDGDAHLIGTTDDDPDGVALRSLVPGGRGVNASGRIAAVSLLSSEPGSRPLYSAILTAEPTSGFAIGVGRERGEAAPGLGGVPFAGFDTPQPPVVDEAGNVLFRASAIDRTTFPAVGAEGIWRIEPSGSVEPVVLARFPVPSDTSLEQLSPWFAANDRGAIAFTGVADGRWQLFLLKPDSDEPRSVLGAGDPVARLPDGVVIAGSARPLTDPDLTQGGAIGFLARLEGPGVDAANDLAIVFVPVGGEPGAIVRTGDEIEVRPGDVRTLSDLRAAALDVPGIAATGETLPGVHFVSDHGEIVFRATFTDATDAIILATIADADTCSGRGDADHDGRCDDAECGDANGDGRIDTRDARHTQRCAVGLHACGALCDADGDGVCDTRDTRLVQRFAVGHAAKEDLVCAASGLP